MNKSTLNKVALYCLAITGLALFFYRFIIPLGFFEKKINKLGQLAWEFDAQNEIIDSPLFDGTNIYLQSRTHVSAINPSSGSLVWKTPIMPSSGAARDNFLKMKDDTLVVIRAENPVVALSKQTGDVIWENQATHHRVLDASTFEDTVYEARQSWALTSFDLHSGEINWYSNVPDRTSLFIFPEKDIVYLGTGSSLLAINASNGQLVWEHDWKGLSGRMAKENHVLYLTFFAQRECAFAALDMRSLRFLWCISGKNDLAFSDINSVLVKDNVFYISGSKLIALAADTGKLIWQSEIRDSFGTLHIYQNKMYVQGQTKVYEVNLSTGKGHIMFSYPNMYITKWMAYSNIEPIIVNDQILITIENNLFAYKLE
jgi:outer membrane protein assembly factor BamB